MIAMGRTSRFQADLVTPNSDTRLNRGVALSRWTGRTTVGSRRYQPAWHESQAGKSRTDRPVARKLSVTFGDMTDNLKGAYSCACAFMSNRLRE
jgi:hypothetical protein